MKHATVIYYTSNREESAFEDKVRAHMLSVIGDLPLISVSQIPMDFGKNICVGDVGVSSHNAHRQFQIGAMAAETPFVIAAEADFLYPPEYFQFVPPREDRCYRADNLYILWVGHTYRQKAYSEGATVVGRKYLIDAIETELAGRDEWRTSMDEDDNKLTFGTSNFETFHNEIPIVTFKTKNGMHGKSPHNRRDRFTTLPHWGTAEQLTKQYI